MKNAFLRTLVIFCPTVLTLWAAAPEVDTSTPKGTAKGVYDLVLAGDIDGMKKLFAAPANDKEKELFTYGFSDDIYAPGLSAAFREKFPTASFPQADKMVESVKGEIDRMAEKIEGDTATLTQTPADAAKSSIGGPFKLPIILNKTGGVWKIAITESRFLHMPPPQLKELGKARHEGLEQFIQDVRAGKYATFEEARAAMANKMQENQKKYAPAPQPAPASQPH